MEALALLAEENYYDVILLDCNLPDIDGYEVARRIRAFESAQGLERTPIVAISALSGSAHQQKCLDSGMQALLTKPLRLSCLSSMLMRWCQTADTMSTDVANVRPEGEVTSAFTGYRGLRRGAKTAGCALDATSHSSFTRRREGICTTFAGRMRRGI